MSHTDQAQRGPDYLDRVAGKLTTAVGAAFPGERAVFRGHDIHKELGGMRWLGMLAFGITGRRLPDHHLQLLEGIWIYTSYPDARIWNNRVAALAGSARSSGNLGVSGALAVSEAWIYGRQNEYQAVDFFTRTVKTRAQGQTLQQCIDGEMATFGRIAGYGRPLANADERIEPAMALARSLALADGPHVALAFELEQHLIANGKPLRMNYGALVSAFAADLGFTPQEYYHFLYPCFLAGMWPCYIEAAAKPEGAIFPTACSDIHYQGPTQRHWPPATI